MISTEEAVLNTPDLGVESASSHIDWELKSHMLYQYPPKATWYLLRYTLRPSVWAERGPWSAGLGRYKWRQGLAMVQVVDSI